MRITARRLPKTYTSQRLRKRKNNGHNARHLVKTKNDLSLFYMTRNRIFQDVFFLFVYVARTLTRNNKVALALHVKFSAVSPSPTLRKFLTDISYGYGRTGESLSMFIYFFTKSGTLPETIEALEICRCTHRWSLRVYARLGKSWRVSISLRISNLAPVKNHASGG